MQLTIPDGAHISISYGHVPMLTPPGPTAPGTVARSVTHSLIKGGLGAVLLVGAFTAGRLLPRGMEAVTPALASAAARSTAAGPPSTMAEAPTAGEVPPALREALAQRPQAVPPPGQPIAQAQSAAAPTTNPFGLHE